MARATKRDATTRSSTGTSQASAAPLPRDPVEAFWRPTQEAADKISVAAAEAVTALDAQIETALAAGLDADVLGRIYDDHVRRAPLLEEHAQAIAAMLRHCGAVHSTRARVKDPAHLIAKVIRKSTLADPITLANYRDRITDLIGLRALHLYKAEWHPIDAFVRETWNLAEKPFAYLRAGDPPEVGAGYRAAKLSVKTHPEGYRSVHYLLRSQPTREVVVAELQVRTIFEEGWSEIDHRVRYPAHSSDPVLARFLTIFNRLAGSADEMGTFVYTLAETLAALAADVRATSARMTEQEAQLQTTISALRISESEREDLRKKYEAAIRTAGEKSSFPAVLGASVLPAGLFDHVASATPAARTIGEILGGNALFPGMSVGNVLAAANESILQAAKRLPREAAETPKGKAIPKPRDRSQTRAAGKRAAATDGSDDSAPPA